MSTAEEESIREPFARITEQNHHLLKEIKRNNFDGFIRLDPTLNKAITLIHAADEVIVRYPQGSFPLSVAYPMVYSSIRLLKACEKRYGRVKVKAMYQAFCKQFRLWFYSGKPRCPGDLFAKKIFQGEDQLVSAICDHNRNIAEPDVSRRSFQNPRKGTGLHGRRTKCMRKQMEEFVAFLKTNPISEVGQGKTVNARALQFWSANQKRFERAAKAQGEEHGYTSAKKLASAYRTNRF